MSTTVIFIYKFSVTPIKVIPWTEEPGGLQSMGLIESDTTERLHFHFSLSCIGEGNGNPLQCSCLENPKDRGAWKAAVYGVSQSRTRLKWLSSSSSSNQSKRKLILSNFYAFLLKTSKATPQHLWILFVFINLIGSSTISIQTTAPIWSVHFDGFGKRMYPWKHYHNWDTEYFHYPQKFPYDPVQSLHLSVPGPQPPLIY